jgi:hypothetical protein
MFSHWQRLKHRPVAGRPVGEFVLILDEISGISRGYILFDVVIVYYVYQSTVLALHSSKRRWLERSILEYDRLPIYDILLAS